MRFSSSVLVLYMAALAAHGQETRPAIPLPAPAPAGSTAPASSAPTVPVGASADPNAPAVSAQTYVIGAGDTLQLTVWREPNLSSANVPVRPDGRISLPLLGDVPAAGMTPMVLGQDIGERLKKYITDPLVTVSMLSVVPKEIFLIGQINHTGPVILAPGMNPLQAIAVAGGITPFAKQKKLYILRKGPKGDQKIPFDYKKALNTGDTQGITLMPGDTIVVP